MTVIGTSIIMTRGDTESITVSIKNGAFAYGDTVELTVRRGPNSATKLIHKVVTEFTDGKAIIPIYPADTGSMQFGRYVYDVQLTRAEGTVCTIVKPSGFEVTAEVTY